MASGKLIRYEAKRMLVGIKGREKVCKIGWRLQEIQLESGMGKRL